MSLLALLLAFSLSPPPAAASPVVAGDYLEVRTCDVYTGPCFANAEVGAVGKEATLAWSIDRGVVDGVDLAGLSVVAVIQTGATLGDPFSDPDPQALILFLDDRAGPAERVALRSFARARLGDLGPVVTAERVAKIDLAVQCCDKLGCAELTVGDEISVSTRCVCEDDIHCGNEYVYYPPLTDGLDVIPAVATEHRVETDLLDTRFIDRERRGAFTGLFSIGPKAAPTSVGAVLGAVLMSAVSELPIGKADEMVGVEDGPGDAPVGEGESADEAADTPRKAESSAAPAAKYRLIQTPRPKGAESSVLPDEIPEAFAKLLDPAGMRLVGADGEAIYDLWFRREIPLGEKPTPGMRIRFPALPLGGLVGVVRSFGKEVDYRESELPEGLYTMRFAVQPEDGDHMGTADTRDFLILCNFEEDKDTQPVADMLDLGEMSIFSSSTDHPLICYLVVPEGDAPESNAMYQHPDRDEWIADVTWTIRANGEDEANRLRVGVVLIGISEHF